GLLSLHQVYGSRLLWWIQTLGRTKCPLSHLDNFVLHVVQRFGIVLPLASNPPKRSFLSRRALARQPFELRCVSLQRLFPQPCGLYLPAEAIYQRPLWAVR